MALTNAEKQSRHRDNHVKVSKNFARQHLAKVQQAGELAYAILQEPDFSPEATVLIYAMQIRDLLSTLETEWQEANIAVQFPS